MTYAFNNGSHWDREAGRLASRYDAISRFRHDLLARKATGMFFSKKEGEQHHATRYLRRICDATSPNLPRVDDARVDTRQNRTIAALLTCWQHDRPEPSESLTTLTRDLSDRGVSLTLPAPIRFDEVVVGFWLPEIQGSEPWFFLGRVQQNTSIGGGFWTLGIEIQRVLSQAEGQPLVPIAKKRLPPQTVPAERPSALLT